MKSQLLNVGVWELWPNVVLPEEEKNEPYAPLLIRHVSNEIKLDMVGVGQLITARLVLFEVVIGLLNTTLKKESFDALLLMRSAVPKEVLVAEIVIFLNLILEAPARFTV